MFNLKRLFIFDQLSRHAHDLAQARGNGPKPATFTTRPAARLFSGAIIATTM
jgi:hypothetical protein